jgi:hypothetical protein
MADAPRNRPRTLKDLNTARLAAAVIANLVLYAVFVRGEEIVAGGWPMTWRAASELVPAGLLLVVITVANGLLSPLAKARLVFWRWRHPLPGCRAFSIHAKHDARINVLALRAKLGSFPKSEPDQNAAWYRLYRSIERDAAVAQGQRDFLFTRDYAALSALAILPLGIAAFVQAGSSRQAATYLAILIAQYLVTRSAAANYGNRFVCTVLAIKSAEVRS